MTWGDSKHIPHDVEHQCLADGTDGRTKKTATFVGVEALHNPIISSVKDKTALNQSKLICSPVHSSTSRVPSIILHFQYGTSNRWTDSVQASPEKLPW